MKRPSLINDANIRSKQRIGVISTIDQERVQAYALGQASSQQHSGYKTTFIVVCTVVVTLGLAVYWLRHSPSPITPNLAINTRVTGPHDRDIRPPPRAFEMDHTKPASHLPSPASNQTNTKEQQAVMDAAQTGPAAEKSETNRDKTNVATIVDTVEPNNPSHGTPIDNAFDALNQQPSPKQEIAQTRIIKPENKPIPALKSTPRALTTEGKEQQPSPTTALARQEKKIAVESPTTQQKLQATAVPTPQEQKSRAGDVAIISALLANDKIAAKPVEASHAKVKESSNKVRIHNVEKHSAVDLSATAHENIDALELRWRQCEELDFFERQTCRWKACENDWGKSDYCPSASAQPNIFNQNR